MRPASYTKSKIAIKLQELKTPEKHQLIDKIGWKQKKFTARPISKLLCSQIADNSRNNTNWDTCQQQALRNINKGSKICGAIINKRGSLQDEIRNAREM